MSHKSLAVWCAIYQTHHLVRLSVNSMEDHSVAVTGTGATTPAPSSPASSEHVASPSEYLTMDNDVQGVIPQHQEQREKEQEMKEVYEEVISDMQVGLQVYSSR